ncbi:MAG: serine--tRNA ligase, partial [Planctomycetota bacterium]
MFDPKILRENPEVAKKACAMKNVDLDVDKGHKLALRRPEIIQELEHLRAEKNRVSDEIAVKKKNKEDASEMIEAMKKIGPRVKELEKELHEVEEEFHNILISIPNLPHESVQEGGEEENLEISVIGSKPEFTFTPKPHWDLAEELDILDLPRGAKIS